MVRIASCRNPSLPTRTDAPGIFGARGAVLQTRDRAVRAARVVSWMGLPLLAVTMLAGGCKKEAARVKKAYETVLHHSGASTGRHRVWRSIKLPGYVFSVRENRDDRARPLLDVDIFVAEPTSMAQIRTRLETALQKAKAATRIGVVRVQAWPEGLLAFGRVVGRAFLAPDGRGWDGKGNQVRGLVVLGSQKPGLWRPSAFDLQVLRGVERRWRRHRRAQNGAQPIRGEMRGGAPLVSRAEAEVAHDLGLTVDSVRRCARNARAYWGRAQWQPSTLLPSQ